MKIYTRTGDLGETSLFAGGRVRKDHLRLHTYGTVDELNSVLGLALAAGVDQALGGMVLRVQSELFVVGADLATPLNAEAKRVVRVSAEMTSRLEQEIDGWERELPVLKRFILPGGSMGGGLLHQARAVCRRAERWLVSLQEAEPVNAEVLKYMNRLSDWLFVAARVANQRSGHVEAVWESG
jgi:cob(I)alamin adenosyltransferase